MIEINLLPIRAARRKESLRFQLSVFILTLFFVFIVIAYLNWSAGKRERFVDDQLKKVGEELAQLNKVVGEIDNLKQQKAKLQ